MDTREKNVFYRLLVIITLCAAVALLGMYAFAMAGTENISSQNTYRLDISERVVRGSLYDRDGRLLALEVPVYSVSLWIPSVRNPEAVADVASAYLPVTREQVLERIAQRSGFFYLARGIDYETGEALQNEINQRNIQGISLEKQYGRSYPYRNMAAQSIGFTDIDNNGAGGIEYYYNSRLYPLPDPESAVTYGEQLVLTLSVPHQALLDRALEDILEDHRADGVSGVIMDGSTGDILAIGSHPTFDPNNPGISTEQQRMNRAVSSMYEPGSVFKVFSLAALIELLGDDHPPYMCRRTHHHTLNDGSTITINCTTAHGEVSTRDIIKYSCNNAIAHLALQADSQAFYDTLISFGFSQRTNAGLPGEAPGVLASPERWSERSKPTIAFGQESAMTALQAAQAATALTNRGMMLQPHIVKEIREFEGALTYEREVLDLGQVISPDTAEEILSFMKTAVEPGGTANRMHIPGVELAAKTGTAQLPDPEGGGYSQTRYLASTIAVVSADASPLIIYIAADYPKAGSIYGATVVVPAIRQIVEGLIDFGEVTPRR